MGISIHLFQGAQVLSSGHNVMRLWVHVPRREVTLSNYWTLGLETVNLRGLQARGQDSWAGAAVLPLRGVPGGVSRDPGTELSSPPGLMAGLPGRCSWRFRRSGSSGTSVSSHCTPWPSAPPSATALRPATWSRARAPAGPASSERLEQGHLRTETKTGPETAGHCCGTARLPSRHPIIYPASAVEAPSQVLDSSKGMWGTVGQDKGLGFGLFALLGRVQGSQKGTRK